MKEYVSSKIFKDRDFPLAVEKCLQRQQMVAHTHDYIELVLVAQGHTIHNVQVPGQKSFSHGLIPGDCFAILPGVIHAYAESHNLVLYNIAFQLDILKQEQDELRKLPVWTKLFAPPSHPGISQIHLMSFDRRHIENALNKLLLEQEKRDVCYHFKSKILLLDVLLAMNEARDAIWTDQKKHPDSGILKSLEYMESHTHENIPLEKMAKIAGMCISSFTQKFRQSVGDSPGEYFRDLKLDKIRRELLITDKSIAELAYSYGFCDSAYLIRHFKKRLKLTPAQYRRQTCSSPYPDMIE